MTGASPSPEIVPALDEARPQIEPNLADDPDFCREVMDYLYWGYWYPQMLMQQRLWPIWGQIDDAWRVKGRYNDIDVSITDPALVNRSADSKGKESGMLDQRTGYSAKSQTASVFKQIKTKTDFHMSISWADGLPVRAKMPETLYEHPLYNPNQQAVDVANELLRQCSDEIGLYEQDRKGRGNWSKYGHAWAAVDFRYATEDVEMPLVLPQDPGQGSALIQAGMQRFGGQQPQYRTVMVQGVPQQQAVWMQRCIKVMETRYQPLRHDDVFIDQTLPGDNIELQSCPVVREHVTADDLWGNDYDADKNPFGWLNVQQAISNTAQQYTLSAQDENPLANELLKKWGQNSQGLVRQENAIKQRWTMYPKLAIYTDPETGKRKLCKRDGIECPTCHGKMSVPYTDPASGSEQMVTCPQCQGRGRIWVEPKRYILQAFGCLGYGITSATVLRIQRNPTVKDKIPLLYGAHLTEDMAGAIPMCCSEASMPAWVQLMTCENQFLDAKNQIINRPWQVPEDHPMRNDNLNRPGTNITFEAPGMKCEPANMGTLDVTMNLQPMMIHLENEIQTIHGMNDNLLGQVSQGRRSASETSNAFDAAKMPITVEIDSYNTKMLGGWAQFHIWNIEQWADRDWILAKTGRTTFGKVQLHAKVADDFMKKQALLVNSRYILELAGSLGPASGINVPVLLQRVAKLSGLPDPAEIASDGGLKLFMQKGFQIITKILGEGVFLPASPDDPHEVYIEQFKQALQDETWLKKTPENMPLLAQRLFQQEMMKAQKDFQMQQQQLQQQAMLAQAQNSGKEQGNGTNGSQPRPARTASTPGQAQQQSAGAQQG